MVRRLLVLVVVVPLLAGCAGDEKLSQEEFIAAGDQLCREFESAAEAFEEPASPEEFTDLLGEAVRLTRELRAGIVDLEPEGEGVEVRDAFLDAIDGTIERASEAQEEAAGGDVEAAEASFDEASEAAQSADAELQGYGFEDCADRG